MSMELNAGRSGLLKLNPMTSSIKNHYLINTKRNLIHPGTDVGQFMGNLSDRYNELWNCYADDIDSARTPSDEFATELIELLLVITDLSEHYKLDILDIIRKINKSNEGLISHLNFVP